MATTRETSDFIELNTTVGRAFIKPAKFLNTRKIRVLLKRQSQAKHPINVCHTHGYFGTGFFKIEDK